jgi:hypothetical protein
MGKVGGDAGWGGLMVMVGREGGKRWNLGTGTKSL